MNGWTILKGCRSDKTRLESTFGLRAHHIRNGLRGSDMAQQILRDPYNFDFLALREPLAERELERGLLAHLRDLLLELGRGFSFVGSQVPLTVDEQTF